MTYVTGLPLDKRETVRYDGVVVEGATKKGKLVKQRMTKERWDALFHAMHRGIDELTFELDNLDPEDRATYGPAEHQVQLAKEAYRILLNRRLDKR